MNMIVNQALCAGCGACVDACPHHAIQLIEGKAVIEESACTGCRQCQSICPNGALQLDEKAVLVTVNHPAVEEIAPIQVSERQISRTLSWGSLALGLASQILPRALNILANLVENRFITQPVNHPLSTPSVDSSNPHRRRRRHGWF